MNKVIKRNYTDKETKGFGGFLKKALPIAGVAANFIPGVGPAASMAINAGANAISSSIPEEQKQIKQNTVNYVPSSYGMAMGGNVPMNTSINKNSSSIGQDARKFNGKSHEDGGIDLENNIEVEGKETTDKVGGQDYVFSKRLKVPGTYMNFAEAHEELVKEGASQQEIDRLAKLQEKVAGRQ